MHLAHPVTIRIDGPRPLRPRMIDGAMGPAGALADAVVAVPLIGVDRRLPKTRVIDDIVQLDQARRLDHVQAHLPRLATDHARDRRSVGVKGAMTPPAVGASAGRVIGVVVRDPFFPPRSDTSRPLRPPHHPGGYGPGRFGPAPEVGVSGRAVPCDRSPVRGPFLPWGSLE